MSKINLHCHTTYSDGKEPVAVMMMEHKRLGYSAFVVTDHLRPLQFGPWRYLSKTSFEQQRQELKKLSKYLEYPAIQGAELWLGTEEILIFGLEVIRELFELAEGYDGNNFTIDMLKYIKDNKNRCACVLCHPRLVTFPENEEFYKHLFPILDGYEYFNSGVNMFTNRVVPDELSKLRAFKNSDAHLLDCVVKGDNDHIRPIKDEAGLIKYIKGRIK